MSGAVIRWLLYLGKRKYNQLINDSIKNIIWGISFWLLLFHITIVLANNWVLLANLFIFLMLFTLHSHLENEDK